MNAFARGKRSSLGGILERAQEFTAQEGLQGSGVPQQVALSRIRPNPGQPRRYFGEPQLRELVASIREHGVLQPILLRPIGPDFQIVFGERRYRAAIQAGLMSVPAFVREIAEEEIPVIAALENLQRENLNRFEEVRAKLALAAQALRLPEVEVVPLLRRLRRRPGESPQQMEVLEALFTQLGGERWPSFVTNGLPVLQLPASLLSALGRGELEYSKAVLIARVPEPRRAELLSATLEEQLTQQQLRSRIAQIEQAPRLSGVSQLRKLLTAQHLERLSATQRAKAEQLMEELGTLLKEQPVS